MPDRDSDHAVEIGHQAGRKHGTAMEELEQSRSLIYDSAGPCDRMAEGEALGETARLDDAFSAQALVFAIAHEVANHLGAVRLQAHLLDDDLDSQSLARASVEIDGLAGRAGPLLALLRPLLSRGSPPAVPGAAWSSIVAGVKRHYEDEGTRGVDLEIEPPTEAHWLAPDVDWLHSLLIALIDSTLAGVPRRGCIRITVDAAVDQLSFRIEDDGPIEDLSLGAALRGRPLAVSLARELMLLVGGRVETGRDGDQTRIELTFPGRPA